MSNLFANSPTYEREMLESAFKAVSILEAWDFLKNYEPPPYCGFMFDSNPQVVQIQSKIDELYGGSHSGASMAFTMRRMQEIAKNDMWNA